VALLGTFALVEDAFRIENTARLARYRNSETTEESESIKKHFWVGP
jgi:hypothetical protein